MRRITETKPARRLLRDAAIEILGACNGSVGVLPQLRRVVLGRLFHQRGETLGLLLVALELGFALPAGSYATALLRELASADDPSPDDAGADAA